MKHSIQHPLRWSWLFACSLLLVLFMTACSGGTQDTSNTTTIPPTPTPSPTPTPTSYTYSSGNSYTVQYPQGWKAPTKTNSSALGVEGEVSTFTNADSTAFFVIEVFPNPNGSTMSTSAALDFKMKAFKAQFPDSYQSETVDNTTTISGKSWDQRSASGSGTQNGVKTHVQGTADAYNYPGNTADTKLYLIFYTANTTKYQEVNNNSFKLMLSSFQYK